MKDIDKTREQLPSEPVAMRREIGEPEDGTSFNIYLPASKQTIKPPEAKPGETLPAGGNETVLLVDDENSIRDLGAQILTKFGYKVVTAGDGENALKLYRLMKEEIDLIILDLFMPGMGGRKCLEELVKVNPQAQVIVSSGCSENGPKKDIMDTGARTFISKPYKIKLLLTTVRKVLDEDL